MSTRNDLTIVVCTYNRADLLRGMLRSLGESLSGCSDEARVLIVDNASTDHTPTVAREAAGHLHLRCVTESKRGLSAARNRAISEVAAGALWFLDDDVMVTRQWFPAACRALARYPEADWMGGRILPQWPPQTPRWLTRTKDCPYQGMLVWYDQGQDDKLLTPQMPSFFGANVMFRTRVFASGHRFDEELGPIGRRPRLGDDVEFQAALHREGRTGRYVPAATVYHPVPQQRLRLGYLIDWHWESGRATVRIARQSNLAARWLGVPRYMYRQAATNLLQGGGSLAIGLLTARSTRWAQGLARLSLGMGKTAAICQTAFAARSLQGPAAPPTFAAHRLQSAGQEK